MLINLFSTPWMVHTEEPDRVANALVVRCVTCQISWQTWQRAVNIRSWAVYCFCSFINGLPYHGGHQFVYKEGMYQDILTKNRWSVENMFCANIIFALLSLKILIQMPLKVGRNLVDIPFLTYWRKKMMHIFCIYLISRI